MVNEREMYDIAYGSAILRETVKLYKEAIEWEKNSRTLSKRKSQSIYLCRFRLSV